MQQPSPPLTRTCNHDSLADSTASACVCGESLAEERGSRNQRRQGKREKGEEVQRRGTNDGNKSGTERKQEPLLLRSQAVRQEQKIKCRVRCVCTERERGKPGGRESKS